MMVRGQWANLARMPGLHPYSFLKCMLGFLMTTESQDFGLTSHPEGRCFLQYSVPSLYWGIRTHRPTGWAPPAGLTNTSFSSNLVFPGGLPSRYWPGSTLLSFSGKPVLGYRVIVVTLSVAEWLFEHYYAVASMFGVLFSIAMELLWCSECLRVAVVFWVVVWALLCGW